jgi:hypothetical protein
MEIANHLLNIECDRMGLDFHLQHPELLLLIVRALHAIDVNPQLSTSPSMGPARAAAFA